MDLQKFKYAIDQQTRLRAANNLLQHLNVYDDQPISTFLRIGKDALLQAEAMLQVKTNDAEEAMAEHLGTLTRINEKLVAAVQDIEGEEESPDEVKARLFGGDE